MILIRDIRNIFSVKLLINSNLSFIEDHKTDLYCKIHTSRVSPLIPRGALRSRTSNEEHGTILFAEVLRELSQKESAPPGGRLNTRS